MTRPRQVDLDAYRQLQASLLAASRRLSTEQVLDLADDLHAIVRRRRHGEGRAPRPTPGSEMRTIVGWE